MLIFECDQTFRSFFFLKKFWRGNVLFWTLRTVYGYLTKHKTCLIFLVCLLPFSRLPRGNARSSKDPLNSTNFRKDAAIFFCYFSFSDLINLQKRGKFYLLRIGFQELLFLEFWLNPRKFFFRVHSRKEQFYRRQILFWKDFWVKLSRKRDFQN